MTKKSANNLAYKIEKSCLYRLHSKRKLHEILLTKKEVVEEILKTGDANYKEKIVQKLVRNKIKNRTCQIPKKYGSLDKIHGRIAKLLSLLETKNYLFSCKKGKSYIDNAKYHLKNSNNLVVKLDIKNYFPSVTYEHIFRFFRRNLLCSEDISNILTSLVTYKKYLPTGCKMSMHIAYFSHMELFDRINEIALKNECIMSLWVDDIIISGKKSKIVADNAKSLIERHGLEYHDGKKFKIYSPKYRKEITGVIINPNGKLKVRNYSQKLIHDLIAEKNKSENGLSKKDSIKLSGCLNEATSIDKKYLKINHTTRQIMQKIKQETQQNSQILIYQSEDGKIKLDVELQQETVWLNQERMATLFGKAKSTINEHIQNIYNEGELSEKQSMQRFGNSEFQQKAYNYYNLDVIISVGYRVKSKQGTQFRIWATNRLKDYIIKGFVLNDERFKAGKSMNYFDELQERIREIRLSERFFYQKIKDIYKTSIDYDAKDEKTAKFFKIVQNKLLWAISKKTAAELVYERSDSGLPFMGMKSVDKKTEKSITKKDSEIGKNYLSEDEIRLLGLLVEQYLAFAQTMANQQTPMYMKDWIEKLDTILNLNGREILNHAGKIQHEIAIEKSGIEYQKFQELQKEREKKDSLKELEDDLKNLKQ